MPAANAFSVQFSAVYVVQCIALQYSIVQYSAVQCSAVQGSAVQCSAMQLNAVHAVQYNTQYSTIWPLSPEAVSAV